MGRVGWVETFSSGSQVGLGFKSCGLGLGCYLVGWIGYGLLEKM